ncbi:MULTISPECIES: hypothetical protein [unclassified Legionella]|uniref:hypothetical protein n=1 Tax=unclassified Legionella TaxID=2622702 RepID=UPI0010548116|nr:MULTISPECIES: hypothetical protein [unclassified Legionella]MDI9818831.1 hypothetical protein [Legionella sp. PL877]
MVKVAGNYTSFVESELGKIFSGFEEIVSKYQASFKTLNSSDEATLFAKEQVEALSALIKMAKGIIPHFDNGKTLGIGTAKSLWGLREVIENSVKTLFPPKLSLILLVKQSLGDLIAESLKITEGYKQLEKKSPGFIQEQFKKALRSGLSNRRQSYLDLTGYRALFTEEMEALEKDIGTLIDDYDFTHYFSVDGKKGLKVDLKNLENDFKKVLLTLNIDFEVKIAHPLSYQLMMEVLALIEQVPEELQSLISFFNPDSITLSIPFLIDITRDGYRYKIDNKIEIDAEQLYKEYKGERFQVFLESLANYFNDYTDADHVQQELAKMALPQQFVDLEKKLIDARIEEIRQQQQEVKDVLANSVNLTSIENARQQLNQIHGLLEEIEKRGNSYTTEPFSKLLQAHASIDKMNVKVDFDLEKPLPARVIIKTESICGFGFAQEIIRENWNWQQLALKELRAVEAQLSLEYNEALISLHLKNGEELFSNFEKLHDNINDLGAIEVIEDSPNKLEQLEEQLQRLAKDDEALTQLQAEAEAQQEYLAQLVSFPTLLSEHREHAKITKEAVSNCYAESEDKIKQCMQLIPKKRQELAEITKQLTLSLQKEKEAQAYAEIMKSANPEVIREQLIATEEKIKEAEVKLNDFRVLLSTKKENGYLEPRPLSEDPLLKLEEEQGLLINKIQEIAGAESDILSLVVQQMEVDLLFSSDLKISSNIELILSTVTNLMDTKGELPENIFEEAELKQILQALEASKALIQTALNEMDKRGDKKINFPFKSMDELKALHDLKTIKGLELTEKEKGLEILLRLVDQEEILADWKKLNSLILFQEERQKLTIRTEVLKLDLEEKIRGYAYLIARPKLIEIQEFLGKLKVINLDIKYEKNKRQKLAEECEELAPQIKEKEEKIAELNQTARNLAINIQVLEAINALLEANKELSGTLDSLEISTAEEKYEGLLDNLSELKELMVKLPASTYAETLESIISQQAAIGQRMSNLIKTDFKNRFDAVIEDVDSIELDNLNMRLDDYTNISGAIAPAFQNVNRLRNRLKELAESEIDVTSDNETSLRVTQKAHQDKLLERYKRDLDKQLKLLPSKYDESQDNLVQCSVAYNNGSAYLQALPLDKLRVLPDETNQSIESLENDLRNRIKSLNEIQQGQKERFDARKELAEKFESALDRYLEQRKKKYPVKDSISRSDLIKRAQFITRLQNELATYINTGNSQPILELITANKTQFCGLHLRPILNRLVVAIKALDAQIPQDKATYITEEKVIHDQDLHDEALAVLETLNDRPQFVSAMKNLYARIEKLKAHDGDEGKIAQDLADCLCARADKFVIDSSQADNFSDKEAFKAFHSDFMTELHSQDDVMSEDKTWKSFILNLAIGLCTVGIALGIKLAVSKISTGYATFFGETRLFKQVKEVDEALLDLTAAAPAA